jgi:uncharacterized integral membrane protein
MSKTPARSTLIERRPRMRRVTRVVRDIDVWSVFKVGIVFHLVVFVIAMVAVVSWLPFMYPIWKDLRTLRQDASN